MRRARQLAAFWERQFSVQLLFGITMFLGAALLFSVQPMIAKMVLPLLGGSPAVWTSCMVFFQASLLAGYTYAHLLTKWFDPRAQAVAHSAVLLLPCWVLPISISPDTIHGLTRDANPMAWLLELLVVTVWLPFFLASTTAPLLQKWFGLTDHPAGKDPYFLYGASNLGSLLALVAYPLLLEPRLSLAQQSQLWAAAYALFAVLTWCCSFLVWQSVRRAAPAHSPAATRHGSAKGNHPADSSRLTALRRTRWLGLAFVPSSLMLGVTTYLSTDIAAMPLLWVIPLMLYLLSFILAFAKRRVIPETWLLWVLPVAVVALSFTFFFETVELSLALSLHLGTFFLAALVCHGQLAKERPSADHLTEFYLWVSIGGVLGGLFNAVVAPLLFDRLLEYPVALLLLCLLRPGGARGTRGRFVYWFDGLLPLVVAALLAPAIVLGLRTAGPKPSSLLIALISIPALLFCYSLRKRPMRFALGVGAILLASQFAGSAYGRVVHRDRSFFGIYRVIYNPEYNWHQLAHGNTLHGLQSLYPAHRLLPLAYYHPTGPIGRVFEVFRENPAKPSVAVVGLGAGSLASYAEPDQEWTFYEIDPVVERIARDPRWFSFLHYARAGKLEVVLADGRIGLGEASDEQYGLIVLDAFTSDSIPLHLLTREALALYLRKLAAHGLLALHISNRHLDLQPVLGTLAADAHLIGRVWGDLDVAPGKLASQWVVMARQERDLGQIAGDRRWQNLPAAPGAAVWTDDFSNIWSIFRWR